MRSVTTMIVCEECHDSIAATYAERLPALEIRARAAGWDTGADHCPQCNNVRALNVTKERA